MVIPIDVNTVAIENAADLNSVVSVNSLITYIYFANDITLTTGITIHPNRASLILDGRYLGVTHTFTDMLSESNTNTLGIRSASSIQMTLRNMIMNGRNYYGIPYVIDSAITKGVSITYENVAYTGRQITYHRHGLTRYIDCGITIVNVTASWLGNEVGEVNRLEIGGKTTITKTNPDYSTFWFCGTAADASFTILEGAEVQITTAGYFMYLLTSSVAVPYVIERGASFKLTTNNGLSYNNDHRISTFLVDENASFEYAQSVVGPGPSIAMTGTLTAKSGSRFFMRADYTNNSPLIRFRSSGTTQNLNLENPKSFVMYKRNSPALNFTSSRPFLLSGGQVNYWETAMAFPAAGTFSDIPLHQWRHPNWSGFEISGNVGTEMSGVSSTLPPPVDPPLAGLQLQTARVLSVGDLPLTVDTVVNNQRPVTGRTDPHANIIIEYTNEGSTYTLTGTADASGEFSIPTPTLIPVGTVVKVSCNVPFLYRTAEATAQEAGELYIFDAPERIRFCTPPLSLTPCILRRDANAPVIVRDERKYRTQWELSLTVDGPMHAPSGHTLDNAVVFVPNSGAYDIREPLHVSPPVRVYVGEPGLIETVILWDSDAGVLMCVENRMHINEEYVAKVTWSVNPI